AIITGRRTYEIADAWRGSGPMPGVPLFVLTHAPPTEVPIGELPYTFVTDGIESAVAQARERAGGKDVALMGATVVQQAFRAHLIDEFEVDLAPVILGGGVRLLDQLGDAPIQLDKVLVVDSPTVTHLRYRVVR